MLSLVTHTVRNMSGEVLGGGVMVAVAALLWVAYFMPTWARRRQYFAMERNAVRLQQTLRILAETAEIPAQVRLEANARTVSSQQKLLAQAETKARAELKASTNAAIAARRAAVVKAAASMPRVTTVAAPVSVSTPAMPESVELPFTPEIAQASRRRLRVQRARRSLLLLGGAVSVVAGIVVGAVSGSWLLLGIGVVASVTALGGLSRLARMARAERTAQQVVVAPPVVRKRAQRFEPVQFEEAPVAAATWTPKPLPRPMYLTRGSVLQTAMASVDAGAELRKAASEAELARRAAEREIAFAAAVTPITKPTRTAAPAASAAQSKFASMGIVGDTESGISDLDDVLRRRRAAG
jgi:hypothetical protein